MRGAAGREALGWSGALAAGLILVAQVASSARAELLFRDGDSLIVALLSRSLLATGPGDWAMSSVLFLPETTVFVLLDAVLPVGTNALLAVAGVLSVVALYGALRLAAGRRRAGSAPVAWSLIALALFCLVAATETSASRDALELASLLLTTTYYSATVIAVVASVGLLRRMLDRGTGGAALLAALGLVAASSTLSNPLYAAWGTVPLTVVLGAIWITSPGVRRRTGVAAAVLLAATGLGFLARMPFAAWIANSGAGYVQPGRWAESLARYADLLFARLSTPLGLLAAAVLLTLVVLGAVRTARSADPGSRLVAATAWVTPLLVLAGAVALGTEAARYLQPLVFSPLLAVVALPRTVPLTGRVARRSVAVAALVVVVAGGLSVPRLAAAVRSPDPDLACVTDWVDASGRTGAGQFWTVRLPKLHAAHPSQLVQVDHRLNGYAWLVDRRDVAVGAVTFLVEDAQTVPWSLPVSAAPERIVDCGRYRILDYGSTALPLGPSRS